MKFEMLTLIDWDDWNIVVGCFDGMDIFAVLGIYFDGAEGGLP